MKNIISKIIGNKTNIIGFILAFFVAIYNLPKYFEAYLSPLIPSGPDSWMTLDPSWILTLNYINLKNLTWGTDFAFTYGPLSYLATRVGWGVDKMDFILYDLFVLINFFLIFYILFKNSSNKIITTLLFLTFLIIPGSANPPIALVFMGFLVFWVRQSIEKPKLIYYAFQIILLILLFFIKLNTGLIGFPIFIIGILYNIFAKKGNIYLLSALLILPFVLLIFISPSLNVDLLNYIKSSTEIISGYNDVMFLEHETKNRLLAILIIVLLSSIFIYKSIVAGKINYLKNGSIFIIFGIPIFTLYKTGFVRGQEADFFINYILIVLAIQDFHYQNFKKIANPIILICIAISIYFFHSNNILATNISEKTDKYYFDGMKNYTPRTSLSFSPSPNKFPDDVLKIIGKKTIDAYPWNVQAILENELNYTPRPVFQAYTAYTPYLENRNFEFYNSAKAPEFVIYDYTSIDCRYALFDESKVTMCLLKNYTPITSFESMQRKVILLQKKKDFKPIKFEKINEYAILLDSPLIIKKDVYYEIGIYNSFLGKICSTINHAPELKMSINLEDGNQNLYHIGKELVASGMFSDRNITTTEDFYKLYNQGSTQTIQQIKYYKFTPTSPSLFKDKVRVTEYKVVQ